MKTDRPLTRPSPLPDAAVLPIEGSNGAGKRAPPRMSRKRLALAVVIAAISDIIGAFFTLAPPVVWGMDVVTALLLFAVLGWRWLLLPGLFMEAIPGLSVFPFWLLVVGAIAVWGKAQPRLKDLKK